MRSKTTTRARTSALVGATLVVGCLTLALAAPVGAQVPTASAVRGSISDCLTIAMGSDGTGPGASAASVDQVWKCQGETDDERLDGEIDLVYNVAGWQDVGAIQWGYARISNEGGTWDGNWNATVDEAQGQIIMAWYTGTGEYEGWTYVETQFGEYQQSRETFGIVYPGDPPPTVTLVPFEPQDLPTAE